MTVKQMTRWLLRPFTGAATARRHLEATQAAEPEVRALADEVAALRQENHITQRIHAQFRGGGRT